MVKMTQSFATWCLDHYPKIFPLIGFGHTELITEEMWNEYIEWCKTDEGKQYLKGGSKYKERGDADDEQ